METLSSIFVGLAFLLLAVVLLWGAVLLHRSGTRRQPAPAVIDSPPDAEPEPVAAEATWLDDTAFVNGVFNQLMEANFLHDEEASS